MTYPYGCNEDYLDEDDDGIMYSTRDYSSDSGNEALPTNFFQQRSKKNYDVEDFEGFRHDSRRAPVGEDGTTNRICSMATCENKLEYYDTHEKCVIHRKCISRSSLSYAPDSCETCQSLLTDQEGQFIRKMCSLISAWRKLNGREQVTDMRERCVQRNYKTPLLSDQDLKEALKKRGLAESSGEEISDLEGFESPSPPKKLRREKIQRKIVVPRRRLEKEPTETLDDLVARTIAAILGTKKKARSLQKEMEDSSEEEFFMEPSTSKGSRKTREWAQPEQQWWSEPEEEYGSGLEDENEEQYDPDLEEESYDEEEQKKSFQFSFEKLAPTEKSKVSLNTVWPAAQVILRKWQKNTVEKLPDNPTEFSMNLSRQTLKTLETGLDVTREKITKSRQLKDLNFFGGIPPLRTEKFTLWSDEEEEVRHFLDGKPLMSRIMDHIPFAQEETIVVSRGEIHTELLLKNILREGIMLNELCSALRPFVMHLTEKGKSESTISNTFDLLLGITTNVIFRASSAVGHIRTRCRRRITDLTDDAMKYELLTGNLMSQRLFTKESLKKVQKTLPCNRLRFKGMGVGSVPHGRQREQAKSTVRQPFRKPLRQFFRENDPTRRFTPERQVGGFRPYKNYSGRGRSSGRAREKTSNPRYGSDATK